MPCREAWRRCVSEQAVPIGVACAVVVLLATAGCKSDLHQQLLERELRYQEDQIYHLQDELHSATGRLRHVAGENASLRRQLGLADSDPAGRRGATPRPLALPAPVDVPAAKQLPDAPAAPRRGGPPVDLAPPVLEDIPPLPTTSPPRSSGARKMPTFDDGEPLSLPSSMPVEAPTATLPVQQLSYEAPTAVTVAALPTLPPGIAARLVVNTTQTACIDADGDGQSDGLSIVVEPRDAEERLVAAIGDLTVVAFDAAVGVDPATGEPAPIACWTIPAADAARNFQPQGRLRGMHFTLAWPGPRPAGDHVRVLARLDAGPTLLEAEATIPSH
jgi:hypothetical protein